VWRGRQQQFERQDDEESDIEEQQIDTASTSAITGTDVRVRVRGVSRGALHWNIAATAVFVVHVLKKCTTEDSVVLFFTVQY